MNYKAKKIRDSGFYSSGKWIAARDFVRKRDKMTCRNCRSFTSKYYEVDHIIELTWDNIDDWNIAYNTENLQLLCHNCHTRKTMKQYRNKDRLFY